MLIFICLKWHWKHPFQNLIMMYICLDKCLRILTKYLKCYGNIKHGYSFKIILLKTGLSDQRCSDS